MAEPRRLELDIALTLHSGIVPLELVRTKHHTERHILTMIAIVEHLYVDGGVIYEPRRATVVDLLYMAFEWYR